jgi:hypothetical protein
MKLIARLRGGLGNQLFIFATAYVLCKRFNCTLYFDSTSGFLRDRYTRVSKMPAFCVSARSASFDAIVYYALKKLSSKLACLVFWKWHVIAEKDFHGLEDFKLPSRAPGTVLLDGLWQSPKYFDKYQDEIVHCLALKDHQKYLKTELYGLIRESQSVAIHIRRADYSNCLSIRYYLRAMELMGTKVCNATYFLFSDDIEWCKAELKGHSKVWFVEGYSDVDDFFFMSQCKHFIIANSTFSWWAAWLSRSLEKVVIAPKRFKPHDAYYADGWIEVE